MAEAPTTGLRSSRPHSTIYWQLSRVWAAWESLTSLSSEPDSLGSPALKRSCVVVSRGQRATRLSGVSYCVRQRSWTHQRSRAEVRASARGSTSRRARVACERQVCRTYEEIAHNGCSCVRFPRTGRTLTPWFRVHLFWRADSFKYKRAATHLHPG